MLPLLRQHWEKGWLVSIAVKNKQETFVQMMEWLKNSNWIWSPDWDAKDKQHPRIMLFRKKIDMEETPLAGTIRISADTRYKLYVNGHLAEFGPSRGDR